MIKTDRDMKLISKTIQTVWSSRGILLEPVRIAIVDSYKKGTDLPEEISDMFSYRVHETETHIKLIIDFM